MSSTPIEAAPSSNHELDGLMQDVQHLLRNHTALKAENEQLKTRIAEQDRIMQTAHLRLISMLKRLPAELAVTGG